jgi:asparagine synthase (glutamine-hydrolysing)
MCGICGVFNLRKDAPVWPAALCRMTARLAHRGPDDAGLYIDRFVGLGHRRLAVIDPANGRQPLSNEDGTVWVAYNGEIYNFALLRRELAANGHRFATGCDTEVIVHAYEEYGDACVSMFNGMFAFAVWDRNRERLLLARDRLGIKPLYYGIWRDSFVFASEIKAILEHPYARAEIDLDAVPEQLLCTSFLDSKTMFKNVRSVAPGTTVSIENGAVRTRRYWSLEQDSLPPSDASFGDCCDGVRGLLESAVRMEMVSDVPLGTLLSGGLDSSLVSAFAARCAGRRLRTYSMDYDENRGVRHDRTDPQYACLVAAAYDTDHTELVFKSDDYFEVLRRVTWHVEKPVDVTAPSLYLLYRGVKPTATVVMSGEGADELFAGYYFFLDRCGSLPQTEFPWAPHFAEVSSLLDPALEKQTGYRERVRDTLAGDVRALAGGDRLNTLLYQFLKHYLVDMLERLDKTSMAWGVESRVPFLDHRLVEYVVRMPSLHKATRDSEKLLLKSIAADVLPPEIIARRKRPVPIPVDPRTVLAERERANALVQSPRSRIGGFFIPRRVDDFFRKRAEFARTDNLALYRTSHALIALEAWFNAFEVAS